MRPPDRHFGATAELDSLAGADRFLGWISDALLPHLGHRVLEVGAGVGSMAIRLAATGRTVLAIEPADNVYPELERRTVGVPGVEVRQVTSQDLLAEGAGSFDSVVYVSVLEHIEDDVAELRTAFGLLRPGGTVAVFVPAMPSLYGSIDHKSGHHRRYDKASLEAAVQGAGLELQQVSYMDALGIAPYFVLYRLFRSGSLSSGVTRLYDRALVPVSRFLEARVGAPPRGKNLVAVARRPPAPSPPGAG